jgi:hypothetical protein
MDVLQLLPSELKAKVFLYLSHPVADIVRKTSVHNQLVEEFNVLHPLFPTLTFDDMLVEYENNYSITPMDELWWCMFNSPFKELFELLYQKCRQPVNPFNFVKACDNMLNDVLGYLPIDVEYLLMIDVEVVYGV